MENYNYLKIMNEFDENSLPSLSETIMGALELFSKEKIPQINFPNFKKPIIVGSGNAKVTSEILFSNKDAIFADENNYKEAASRESDGAIIFSASGEKHAVIIANYFKEKNIETYLVTCNQNATAKKIVGENKTIVTKKNKEPYTYNTSTYMGWILAFTKEDPEKIYNFIKENVEPKIPKSIGNYNGYLLVTPEFFSIANHLFEVKFIELFARRVARDVKTFEELKHAITIVPYEKELCIEFGEKNTDFDGDKLKIPLPKDANIGTIMAIGYFVIGKIQESKPQYFKENIKNYIEKINKTEFGKGLGIIVK